MNVKLAPLCCLYLTCTSLFLFSAEPAAPSPPAVQPAVASAPTDWVFTRGNPEMTGISLAQLKLPLEQVWEFRTMPVEKARGDMLVSSAVVRAGKVYFGNKEGDFYCLELETGKQLWKVSAPKGSFDGAAAFSGDLVIAGSTDVHVYAWNADTGKEVWKYETEGEIHAAANVWRDPATQQERLFIGSYDYKLYCLEPQTGKLIWSAETGYYINGGSAVSKEGKIVFGGCDSVLHVHDAATGKEEKQIEIGAYIGNNVALDEGNAYVAHYGNRVGAYSLAAGVKLWEYGDRDFEYYAAPAVTEQWVIAAGRDKRLHGLDRATGKQQWEYRCRDQIDSSPLICGNELVLFGCDDGCIYGIQLADGKELWKAEIGAAVKASPAVAGPWLIIGADDGVLYAYRSQK
jgi:eukaryotic-like serine/threonine-protein kinase